MDEPKFIFKCNQPTIHDPRGPENTDVVYYDKINLKMHFKLIVI